MSAEDQESPSFTPSSDQNDFRQPNELRTTEEEDVIEDLPFIIRRQSQPPSEKAGAGILIRNLHKPKPPPHHNEDNIITNRSEDEEEYYLSLSPTVGDTVKIHYEAYLYKQTTNHNTGGTNRISRNAKSISPFQDKPFDSSRERNLPLCFVVGKDEVIEGLDIAVEHMTIGQLVEVTIPYLYAYGEQGYAPQIPPRSTLVFHVELLDFTSGDVIQNSRKWQA